MESAEKSKKVPDTGDPKPINFQDTQIISDSDLEGVQDSNKNTEKSPEAEPIVNKPDDIEEKAPESPKEEGQELMDTQILNEQTERINLEEAVEQVTKEEVKDDLTSPQLLFHEDERILCFHGTLIYDARIIKVDKGRPNPYHIHYTGWNKKWNEWIDDMRILKYNVENLQRQKDLETAQNESVKPSKKGASAKASSTGNKNLSDSGVSTPGAGGKFSKKKGISLQNVAKKRSKQINVESETFFEKKQEIHIPIPDELKSRLVDDWEMVNFNKKLGTLPATPSIAEIMTEYLKTRPEGDEVALEITESLKDHFDSMLANQLLYNFEKPQMTEVSKHETYGGMYFSQLYGAPHLLRLMTKLGQCLAYTRIEKDVVEILNKELAELFQFLIPKKEYFSSENYYVPSADYIKKVPKS